MKTLRAAVLLLALAATGCQNGVNLPDVNLTIPLVNSVVLGPSAGIPGGVSVAGSEFSLGEFCGIVDAEAIQESIRAALGETAAGLIEIEKITLKGIVFSARKGSFSSFSALAVSIAPKDQALTPFGEISADEGLGAGFTILTDSPIDVIAYLANTDCITASLALTGRTPNTDLDMRIDAYVTVDAKLAASKALW